MKLKLYEQDIRLCLKLNICLPSFSAYRLPYYFVLFLTNFGTFKCTAGDVWVVLLSMCKLNMISQTRI